MQTILAHRYVLAFVGILAILIPGTAHAQEVHENRVMSHDLEVELHLKEHTLRASDHMLVSCGNAEKVSCLINKSFQILSVSASNMKLDFKTASSGDGQRLEITIPPDLRESDSLALDIAYEGCLFEKPGSPEKEDVGETTGTISEEGVYLSPACLWYPDIPNSLATFKVTVITPAGYEAVTQGILVSKKSVDNKTYTTWEEKNVSEDCHLVAGRYKVTSIKHNGIDIYAYFFPEEQGLVETYINATKRYMDMYQKILGNYPYGKFAIVENFFQTGYGMPSFTLLGNTVVKLPFIVDTSLGHEILHNWWGNSVFVEESQGNWCEGLTAYMADYYYKELKDTTSANDYRKDICRKYTNYVTGQNDFPLKKFIGRRDQATQAIGYGKTAMVFHMLRQMIGDDLFYQSVRRFYKEKLWQQANWKDIQRIFEDTCKMELSWFFEQWINQAGAPFIELGKTEVTKSSNGWLTRVEIIQTCPQTLLGKGKPYRLSVPIQMELDGGNFYTVTEIKESSSTVVLQTSSQPVHIAVDPQCNVFRRLHREEIPPTIDFILGDPDKIIVYPTGGEGSSQAAYKSLAELLADKDGAVKADTGITETEMTQKSLFILGGLAENKLAKLFPDNLPENFTIDEGSFMANKVTYRNKNNSLIVTSKNPKNMEKGIALFLCSNSDTIRNVGFKIPHYGKYSYLVFADGKNVDKGAFAITDSPLQRYLKK
ncbi:MAG TPA: M1 family metallopeptidase [Candidatus Wunengus sp. YC60]|uniref:M1 family metallopeptidase n=1 Tax=Candidatus Wunengus sp. YC60 TaxID=3367697 RepID=UPI004028C0C2